MPIREADPWRRQYFDAIPCPPDIDIPTEDADAWLWNPHHRWIYDKLAVAQSQGIAAAPHGVEPPAYPVFSKPITNLRGMGIDSRQIASPADYRANLTPGHFWMELLTGEHVSSDAALLDGKPVWWRHSTGIPGPGGIFDHWIVEAAPRPVQERDCGHWMMRHLAGYTGMVNIETIAGRIIEVHLRFADQWPDLYGPGWVEALIALHAQRRWSFDDTARTTGYSVVLFGPKDRRYHHPDPAIVTAITRRRGISSVQITFHEDRSTAAHAMPPGGFRLAIVNATDLDAGKAAREDLRCHLLSDFTPVESVTTEASSRPEGRLPADPVRCVPGTAK